MTKGTSISEFAAWAGKNRGPTGEDATAAMDRVGRAGTVIESMKSGNGAVKRRVADSRARIARSLPSAPPRNLESVVAKDAGPQYDETVVPGQPVDEHGETLVGAGAESAA